MVLNPKQKAFADYYLASSNAYESAIKAGYSEKYAKAQSFKLLDNVGIASYMKERLAELDSKRVADANEVLEYLTKVMRGESESEVIVTEGMTTRKVMKRPDEKERTRAAELLGKRHRLFTDKVEVKDEGKEQVKKSLSSMEQMLQQMNDVEAADVMLDA